MVIFHEEDSQGVKWEHTYLRWQLAGATFYLDPTVGQFDTPVPYHKGRVREFPAKPSDGAAALIKSHKLGPR